MTPLFAAYCAEMNFDLSALEPMIALPGREDSGVSVTQVAGQAIDQVFIGSCTNARLDDLRAAARVIGGGRVKVPTLVVAGSTPIQRAAEAEGLDRIFRDAGCTWGESGCSMCCGMNGDIIGPRKRSASTSNRNFEGRQGKGGRTHLVSPTMATAAAIEGHFVDIRNWS
mgnify:CR=1 FL=1